LLGPSIAAAQLPQFGGSLSIYSDEGFTDTTYNDQAVQPFSVYVVHSGITASPALSVCFGIEESAGITFSWIGDVSPWTIVDGDSRTGIDISYDTCLAPDPGLVLEIRYFGVGTSAGCSALTPVPHPDSPFGEIEVVTCNFQIYSAQGNSLHVSCTVPVEQTTWGKVKSLFR
jgi:hypothetical protein